MSNKKNRFQGRALEEISIYELDLSVRALNVLPRAGISNVRDCIDYFNRYYGQVFPAPTAPRGFFTVMAEEVEGKIKAAGLWPIDFDTDLFKLSLNEILLPEVAIALLHSLHLDSVGACIKYFRSHETPCSVPVEFRIFMNNTVKEKLKVAGYWPSDLE